jgi:hypothetical protein
MNHSEILIEDRLPSRRPTVGSRNVFLDVNERGEQTDPLQCKYGNTYSAPQL